MLFLDVCTQSSKAFRTLVTVHSTSPRTNPYIFACHNRFPARSFGKSVRGVPLQALEISSSAGQFDGKPYFKFVGNVHGDEPSGRWDGRESHGVGGKRVRLQSCGP